MGISTLKIEPHWNYFLAIERDIEELSRYVAFDQRNFKCFSMEIARILLAAGAETDVVCKQVCKCINAGSTAENIHQYRDQIKAAYPGIPRFRVLIPRFGLTLKPWDEWNKAAGVPLWWTAYNKTKHERDSQYQQANLKNALNAVAGLYVMALYLYRGRAEAGRLLPSPALLRPGDNHFVGNTFIDELSLFGINYRL